MNIVIKKANLEDWKIIQNLNHQLFLDNNRYDPLQNNNWPYTEKGVKFYKNATSNPEHCVFIAYKKEDPIAYLHASKKDWGYRPIMSVEIDDMFVKPEFRGKGIGSQLVEEFKKWCRKNNFEYIYVSAYFTNQKAINFYKKNNLLPIDIGLEGKA